MDTDVINKIDVIKIETCIQSEYIRPKSMYYVQNGHEKRWDMIDAHNSVAILLYHEEYDAFVFVKQFRPAIYLKNGDGYTYELCAGLVDKDKSLEQIAIEEIIEETGYAVPLEKLERITSFFTAVGLAGGKQTLFYAPLKESLHVNEGGGIDNEEIEVVYVPKDEVLQFMYDENIVKTSGLMFSLMWFFDREKSKQIR